tara:strand:- start:52345 stop:52605 length:261 start_codon:yes stop_codon:yes gene_type:complete
MARKEQIKFMTVKKSIYRLIGLDGRPHSILDAPYESMDAALLAAKDWMNGQAINNSFCDRAIGVEVMTQNGSWRTVSYSHRSVQSA